MDIKDELSILGLTVSDFPSSKLTDEEKYGYILLTEAITLAVKKTGMPYRILVSALTAMAGDIMVIENQEKLVSTIPGQSH